MSYNSCYQCGQKITDDYPSHLCAACRRYLTMPESPKTFYDRLTAEDKELLRAMKIGI